MGKAQDSQQQEGYVKVAVFAALRNSLAYRVQAPLKVYPGQRVLVPLGSRKVTGIALESTEQIPAGVKPREVLRVVDADPVLSPELLALGLWISDYYLAPPGEVFRAMLPLGQETYRARRISITEGGKTRREELASSLLEEVRASEESRLLNFLAERPQAAVGTVRQKFGREATAAVLKHGWAHLNEVEAEKRKALAVKLVNQSTELRETERKRSKSPAAVRMVDALERQGGFVRDHRELLRAARATLAALRRLERDGVVTLADSRSAAAPETHLAGLEWDPVRELTPGQACSLESLVKALELRELGVFVLHGVTGSGKTEVYLRLIERCLAQGRSAMMLVPEIALTPMMQLQFAERFSGRVAVLHSALTEAGRRREWWKLWRDEAQVVLGTRSAVFAPTKNLGLVIVDEEHDSGYKQQETPRYNARDVAIVRARIAKALVVLGSATPSLESFWNVRQGKYKVLSMNERVAGRSLAEVGIVDMRLEFRETHSQALISRQLHSAIEAQLAGKGQIMILLNHRGYSWFLLCRSCGNVQTCVNCSISLTYHRREQRLVCHYCGYAAPVPRRCPGCGSEYLHYVGEGTENIEGKLAALFPGARIGRLDRDVAKRAGQYLHVLSEFRSGRLDILVGTQLIAKGHDFPGVTLVGVISADLGLRLPEFRAAEWTFQLLTQAAGRAGRGEIPGRVLVQTFYPEHYAILFAANQDYPGFFAKEIRFRELMHYPPATALANVVAQDAKLERAVDIAGIMAKFLESHPHARYLKILGPQPAPVAKIKGHYRMQILLKSDSRARLNGVLRGLTDFCSQRRIASRSVMLDIDPLNIM